MQKFIPILFLLLNCSSPPPPAPDTFPDTALRFVSHLIADSSSADSLIDTAVLQQAFRLGIQYDDVRDKFLIQYDIDPEIKEAIRNQELNYDLQIAQLEDGFRRVDFLVAEKEYQQSFYFSGNRLVSPSHYVTRNWKTISSRYFQFVISNPADYHPYAAQQLDDYVDSLARQLQIEGAALEKLASEKIRYILCDNTDEMKQICGFELRGIYLLATDEIVSTFNCHYHEVAHLLINYKLSPLPLLTHPFFQEGFAAAVGGRGGKRPRVIGNLGSFVQQSGVMSYADILHRIQFRQNDASFTYPLSGIYNRFLLDEWTMDRYLTLYRVYSRTGENRLPRRISEGQLPDSSVFFEYLQTFHEDADIRFPEDSLASDPLLSEHWGQVWEDGEFYRFRIRGSIRLIPPKPFTTFQSKEFREIFPDVRYAGEQFLLEVTESEVKFFNFYNAMLVAFFANGLSVPQYTIRDEAGYYRFSLRKSLFILPIQQFIIAQ